MTPLPLPATDLDTGQRLGARFAAQGAWTFRDAARLVHALPYGRTQRGGPEAVLREGRGTSSTKHALLAALAQENGLGVTLHLGLYPMSEATTPGVGPALRAHGLTSVPEAHVVLGVGDERVDLTWPGDRRPVPPLAHEETIRPDQVGVYERAWHRRHLDAWARAEGRDPDAVWAAREAAVAALSWR